MNLLTGFLFLVGLILAMSDGPLFPLVNLVGVALVGGVALMEGR
jgi:hypothetical protein